MNKKLYVIRRKSDGWFHCMGGHYSKDIKKAKLYETPKTAIKFYHSSNGDYEDLELVAINIVIYDSFSITNELYKEYKNDNYLSYLSKS